MAELHRLETIHKKILSPTTLAELYTTRDLLKRLTHSDTSKALMWLKQKYYEKVKKVKKVAWRFKTRIESKRISSIRTKEGAISNCPDHIGTTTRHYITMPNRHTLTQTPTAPE
ncbi:Hypothetical predicted protein [Pelobates cultripes]|uniref:Uncharacterized protein n=1 Tax=Pelobates cultripes TaxID=61616 RepID=A0AAD1W517_PELCU|nr:Hypothetical predicted protein [Pelobates cultripes]